MWIALVIGGGAMVLAAAAVFVAYAIRSAHRERREAEAARLEFAARFGFELGTHSGPFGEDPHLRGRFDGLPLELGEHWLSEGGGRGWRRITRWQFVGQTPWPGGLVAYTPGFRQAVGGPHGAVHDTSHPIRALLAEVNDLEIGDEELDRALAIDATDLAVVRRLLTSPEVKRWLLRAVTSSRARSTMRSV